MVSANVFGTLGYISVIFQWLWTTVVVAYPILSSDLSFVMPTPGQPAEPGPPAHASPLMFGVAITLTILVFAFVGYTLWKLPKTIGLGGAKVTHKVAETIIPVVSRHKRVPKRKRLQLTGRIRLAIKALIVIIPYISLVFASHIDNLSPAVIWVAGTFCMVMSILYFGVQILISKIGKLPLEEIW